MSKVAIIGYGHVGKGMQKIFPDAVFFDKNNTPQKVLLSVGINGDEQRKEFINSDCDLAIVCVPTPPVGNHEQAVSDNQDEFLSVDTSIVEETIAWLKTPLILIKSTVPPGTTDELARKYNKKICFSPEYMGEGGYYIPPQYVDPTNPVQHPFVIVGGEKNAANDIIDIFVSALGPAKTYFQCSAVEAECIKYMENTWIATKVTFANEWKNICDRFGATYNIVREGWALDARVEKMHTAVFKDRRGFGGKCLPKDLHGIIAAVSAEGYIPTLLEQVWKSNQRIRRNDAAMNLVKEEEE